MITCWLIAQNQEQPRFTSFVHFGKLLNEESILLPAIVFVTDVEGTDDVVLDIQHFFL